LTNESTYGRLVAAEKRHKETAYMNEALLTLIAAAVPGVLIALLAHQLDLRRDVAEERRISQNARSLLKLEVMANQAALQNFWTNINALDLPDQRRNANDHLAAMTERGLLSYQLPEWDFARWEHLSAQALSAFTTAELAQIDALNRGIRTLSDLYKQLITITPDEMAELNKDRFWVNRFSDWRSGLFTRLTALAEGYVRSPINLN
jgi:Zn-dependent oligopeptidase